MSASTSVGTEGYGTRVPWGDVLLSAIASVSWALIGMAGTAVLGLRLLDADAAGSLGPMTAAVVALGAGGSVTPDGDVSVFGLKGAEAHTAIEITPLGVSLVGALFLSFFFLRSLRAAGVVVSLAELLARAGAVVALFVAMTGRLAWAGHDVITIDGASIGLDDLPGGGDGGDGGPEIPGLGDVGGDIGGLLPDRIGDLVGARAAVGFTVDTAPTLLGGLVWSAGVLLIALLASRRTPLPRGCGAVHRVVRPAVSAVVTVALTAVAAGCAAAVWAAIGDDHPRRIAGAALLGAPNGAWLGLPVGLFVPWDGRATGALVDVLPAPLDDLLGSGTGEPVTLGRLAELDGRVWLLGVAAALTMLLAGVLTAVRTPVGHGEARSLAFTWRCALRLGVTGALTLPLLSWLTEVSVDGSLSVLGIDAFGAGIDLRGHLGAALLLGAVWGAGAGALGALLARVSGAAGTRASGLALGAGVVTEGRGAGGEGGVTSVAAPSEPYRPGARTGGPARARIPTSGPERGRELAPARHRESGSPKTRARLTRGGCRGRAIRSPGHRRPASAVGSAVPGRTTTRRRAGPTRRAGRTPGRGARPPRRTGETRGPGTRPPRRTGETRGPGTRPPRRTGGAIGRARSGVRPTSRRTTGRIGRPTTTCTELPRWPGRSPRRRERRDGHRGRVNAPRPGPGASVLRPHRLLLPSRRDGPGTDGEGRPPAIIVPHHTVRSAEHLPPPTWAERGRPGRTAPSASLRCAVGIGAPGRGPQPAAAPAVCTARLPVPAVRQADLGSGRHPVPDTVGTP
ncbi:streptophobe family protein [Streptomyces sp. R1]|nr:streptophobe family protein [Streptomyces sp. R1]